MRRRSALDSTFAVAWAELSINLTLLYANSTPDPETARKARAAAERAIAVDPQGVAGHRALGRLLPVHRGGPRTCGARARGRGQGGPGRRGALRLCGAVARTRGRFDEALGYRASLRPGSPLRRLGRECRADPALAAPARRSEALAERALALAPGNPTTVQRLAMIVLSEGDLPGARQALARATEVAPAALAAYMAVYWDLGWVLDDAGQRLVLSLGPEAYDDDPASIAIVRAQLYGWRGDVAASRAWGDSAQRHFADQMREPRTTPSGTCSAAWPWPTPAGATRRWPRASAAWHSCRWSRMPRPAPYLVHQLARIYLRAGQPEKAIDSSRS